MKVLAVTLGSIGDLLPFIVAGTALRDRGHEVIFASHAGYESLVRMAGFEFRSIWDRGEATLDDVLVTDPGEAWNRVRRDLFAAATAPTLDFIEGVAAKAKCTLLASWSAYGARLAHEKLNIPLCSVYLSPHALSEERPDPAGGTKRLAFFPEWFCPPQSGWPAGVSLTGFPMFEDALVPRLPPELEQFLAQGERPVVFTPGTFARHAETFFRESLAACTAMNLRAVFLTPYAAQIPPLPPTVRHFKYIALQRLVPRAAALVHHGGIGTSAQAMRAGIPQLVAPVFFDQFDNASRLEALGIGKSLSAGSYNRDSAAESLRHLLDSDPVKRNCSQISGKFTAQNPVREICKIVESLG